MITSFIIAEVPNIFWNKQNKWNFQVSLVPLTFMCSGKMRRWKRLWNGWKAPEWSFVTVCPCVLILCFESSRSQESVQTDPTLVSRDPSNLNSSVIPFFYVPVLFLTFLPSSQAFSISFHHIARVSWYAEMKLSSCSKTLSYLVKWSWLLFAWQEEVSLLHQCARSECGVTAHAKLAQNNLLVQISPRLFRGEFALAGFLPGLVLPVLQTTKS